MLPRPRVADRFRRPALLPAIFDPTNTLSFTLLGPSAERLAHDAVCCPTLPDASVQHLILHFAPHDLVDVAERLRHFLGQLGTVPAVSRRPSLARQ